jgi:hypothetical protein
MQRREFITLAGAAASLPLAAKLPATLLARADEVIE